MRCSFSISKREGILRPHLAVGPNAKALAWVCAHPCICSAAHLIMDDQRCRVFILMFATLAVYVIVGMTLVSKIWHMRSGGS